VGLPARGRSGPVGADHERRPVDGRRAFAAGTVLADIDICDLRSAAVASSLFPTGSRITRHQWPASLSGDLPQAPTTLRFAGHLKARCNPSNPSPPADSPAPSRTPRLPPARTTDRSARDRPAPSGCRRPPPPAPGLRFGNRPAIAREQSRVKADDPLTASSRSIPARERAAGSGARRPHDVVRGEVPWVARCMKPVFRVPPSSPHPGPPSDRRVAWFGPDDDVS